MTRKEWLDNREAEREAARQIEQAERLAAEMEPMAMLLRIRGIEAKLDAMNGRVAQAASDASSAMMKDAHGHGY